MMKIAILYICTGKYSIFWKDFYKSSEIYFLKDHRKDYFVFTDADILRFENKNNVHKIYQENLGWPGNTLFRFKMFEAITDTLKDFDYIFFFNANAKFITYINEEILPINDDIVVVQHPGFYNAGYEQLPYEKDQKSLAHCVPSKDSVYVQGCLSGGKAKEYIQLINTLKNNTDIDYNNGIIAIWHDESHLNKYIQDVSYKLLNPGYCYPSNFNLPFTKKIIMRDKNNYMNVDYLRGLNSNRSLLSEFIYKIKSLLRLK